MSRHFRAVPTTMYLQRHKLGVPMHVLGARVQIDPDFLSRCERGEGLLVPADAERVARVLGVKPEDLQTPVAMTELELAALRAEVERLEADAAAIAK